jgi:MFS family permease
MTVPSDAAPPVAAERQQGFLSGPYRWIGVGMWTLVFLSAFEALAVTTVMPIIGADLGAGPLYALAFSGPLAVSVIGMVVAGTWCDRSGPRRVLYASVGFFVAGLLVAGTATNMGLFVSGRLLQGLGSGGLTVALYVAVARVFPARLHPQIFGAFAAAWVIPSLIGPLLAGIVADLFSWHWVFLGVVGLSMIAMGMVVPGLRTLGSDRDQSERMPWRPGPIGWAAVAAGGVLVLNLSAELGGWLRWVVPIVAAAATIIAVRPLLPRGTLRAVRGLPSTILVRGLAAGAFFGAEIYLPLLFTDHFRFSASLAGLSLVGAALAWSAASWAQGRFTEAIDNRRSFLIGPILLAVGIACALATVVFELGAWLPVAGWALAGGGMGLMYPRMSVMTLAYSSEAEQGFNSSALSISDALGSAFSLAATAVVFAALLPQGGVVPFAGVFALTGVIILLALPVGRRAVVS